MLQGPLIDILKTCFSEALAITLFVFAMMVVVEVVNLRLEGRLAERLGRSAVSQSLWGSVFGLVPGCLGLFVAVTLYEHGILRFGALLSCMIATTGDEAFLMMALVPGDFLKLSGLLLALALVLGVAWDRLAGAWPSRALETCSELVFHDAVEGRPGSSMKERLRKNLLGGDLSRWAVLSGLLVYGGLVAAGLLGSGEQLWVKLTILGVVLLGIVSTLFAEEHFLREHLWSHLIRRHLPKIFLWILGTLLVLGVANAFVDLRGLLRTSPWLVLVVAGLVGLIPQSGPHFIFITLFAQGILPFSVLFMNSMVQDGHGGLPLLAFDRKAFLIQKGVKLVVAAGISATMMAFGL